MFKRLLTTVLMAALLLVPALDADAGKRRADQFQADESFIGVEQGSAPSNPAAGSHKLYSKSSDGRWYTLDSSGTERAVEQDRFCTVTADSGTDPVCDALNDTLSILGGDGVDTSGDSSTDTVTIAADFATQGEAEAGTSSVDVMSPARSKDQFDYYIRWGLKNAIIDGDFDLWLEGTSFNDPNDYTATMWRVLFGTGNTVAVTRQAFTVGQTDVPGEPTYFLRIDKTAGTGPTPELEHQIEDVRTFAGETVTVSYYAKADSSLTVDGFLAQKFGTGGSPSSTVSASFSGCAVTTSWTKCVETVSVPSISGKTLGTNDDHYLQLQLNRTTNANATLDVAHVQVEKGSVATEFERRPLAVERSLVSRYFWKTYRKDTTPGTNTFNGIVQAGMTGVSNAIHTQRITMYPSVPMRAVPTVTLYTQAGTSGSWDTSQGEKSAGVASSSNTTISIELSTNPDSTGDSRMSGHAVFDARF